MLISPMDGSLRLVESTSPVWHIDAVRGPSTPSLRGAQATMRWYIAAWTALENCCYDINQNNGGLMSWMPTNDPVLGDPKSCDALELVIVPRTRDLGDGFEVRRALPHGKRQMVGPFIFFDHFGPVQFMSGKGMDVRPHPHIGLATVSYLFDG